MNHAYNVHGRQRCCDRFDVFRFGWVATVDCAALLRLDGHVTNTNLESDSNGRDATRFEACAEVFCNAPAIVRNDNCSIECKRGCD